MTLRSQSPSVKNSRSVGGVCGEGGGGGLQAFGAGFEGEEAGGFRGLDDDGEHAVEGVHAGVVEDVEAGGVAVGGGTVGAGAGDLERHFTAVVRTEVAVLVYDPDSVIGEVLAVGAEGVGQG